MYRKCLRKVKECRERFRTNKNKILVRDQKDYIWSNDCDVCDSNSDVFSFNLLTCIFFSSFVKNAFYIIYIYIYTFSMT